MITERATEKGAPAQGEKPVTPPKNATAGAQITMADIKAFALIRTLTKQDNIKFKKIRIRF